MQKVAAAAVGAAITILLVLVGGLVANNRTCQQDRDFMAKAERYFSTVDQLTQWALKVTKAATPNAENTPDAGQSKVPDSK